jgi:glycosyltransferase involved in cell wall biosynthesis
LNGKTFIIAPKSPPIGGISVLAELLTSSLDDAIIFDSKIPSLFRRNPYGKESKIIKRDGPFLVLIQIIYVFLSFYRFLFELLRKKIGVVHIISSTGPGLYRNFIYAFISKALKLKLIFHLVGDIETHVKNRSNEHRNMVYFLLRQFDEIIVQSETHYKFLSSVGIKSRIIRNPSIFENLPLNSDIDYSLKSKKYILTVGVFGERKGFYRILNFINSNSSFLESNNYHFVFAGNGSDKENLILEIKKNNLEKFISVFSNVDNNTLAALYSGCYCFLLPTSKDGMPLVLIDALYFGNPIVSNTVGCIPDIISDKRLLSEDLRNWEEVFKNFLDLKDSEVSFISERNSSLYKNLYSKSNFISQFQQLYAQ